MKNAIVVCGIIGALAGGGTATLAVAFMASPATDSSSSPTVLEYDGDEELERQISGLAEEIRGLSQRILSLETQPVAAYDAAPARTNIPDDVVAALDPAQLEELQAAMRNPEGELSSALLEGVTQALANIRDQEDQERDAQRQERAAERLEERLKDLTEKLGLAPYQTDEMRRILSESEQKRDAAMKVAREGGDFMAIRESMGTLREEANLQIAQVLSPAQYDQYTEMGSGRGDFRGFRGGGDSGGGGGGDRTSGGDGGGGRRGRGN